MSAGLEWGPLTVEPVAAFDRSNGTYRVLGLRTAHRDLDVYVSPTGRSVRVFSGGKELKATE